MQDMSSMSIHQSGDEVYELYNRVVRGRAKKEGTTNIGSIAEEMLYLYSKVLRNLSVVAPTLEQRVTNLEKDVCELKRLQFNNKKVNLGDLVYDQHREELEKDHLGQIVAIDSESGTICGIGNSILEAYEEARKKCNKTVYHFRKVGSPYICRLR